MADRHEVKCVNKSDRYNPWERITHIGGDGWKLSQQDAIDGIEAGKWRFFVRRRGSSLSSAVLGDQVEVIVAVSRFGNKYLKTEADGEEPNNLLSLRECP